MSDNSVLEEEEEKEEEKEDLYACQCGRVVECTGCRNEFCRRRGDINCSCGYVDKGICDHCKDEGVERSL